MAFFDSKSPLKSLTIWGSLLSLGSCVESLHDALRAVPVEALPPNWQPPIGAALGVLGAVVAIVGRFKATTKVSLKP